MHETGSDCTLYEFLNFCGKAIAQQISNVTNEISKQITGIVQIPSLLSNSHSFEHFVLEESSSCGDFLSDNRGISRFINVYTKKEIISVIKKSKLNLLLKEKGFDDWYVELDLSDSFSHYLYIRSKHLTQADKYIAFLICRFGQYKLQDNLHSHEAYQQIHKYINIKNLKMMDIKWLSLQNPELQFNNKKPRLPGQRYPGSGLGRAVFDLIKQQCRRHKADGISNVPEYFHNAVLYEGFRFIDPEQDALFCKMKEDLWNDIRTHSLSKVSWAVSCGALYLDDQQFKWKPGEFVLPLSFRMKAYFYSTYYLKKFNEVSNKIGTFYIKWNEFQL